MVTRPALRSVLIAALAVAAGWFLRGASSHPVVAHAAEDHRAGSTESALAFELSGIARETSLTVYSPETHTLYVYPAVSQGNSTVNCEFMLRLGRVGGPVQRTNCQPGSLLPDR